MQGAVLLEGQLVAGSSHQAQDVAGSSHQGPAGRAGGAADRRRSTLMMKMMTGQVRAKAGVDPAGAFGLRFLSCHSEMADLVSSIPASTMHFSGFSQIKLMAET